MTINDQEWKIKDIAFLYRFLKKEGVKYCSNKLNISSINIIRKSINIGLLYDVYYKSDISKYIGSLALRRSKMASNPLFMTSLLYLKKLYENQNGICAISGVPIYFNRDRNYQTCSLDRINPKLGYLRNNVQWTHKIVNMMKYTLSMSDFIDWVHTIYNNSSNNINISKSNIFNDTIKPKQLIGIGETSKILGVGPQTIRNYVSSGKIVSHTLPSGHRRFDMTEILNFAKNN